MVIHSMSIIIKQEISNKQMKQQDSNAQYLFSQQIKEPYKPNSYSQGPMQYFAPNYSYYSMPHLYYNSDPWQFATYYQPCSPSNFYPSPTEQLQQPRNIPQNPSINPESQKVVLTKTETEFKSQEQVADDRSVQMKITRANAKNDRKIDSRKDRLFKKGAKTFTSYYWSQQENRRYVQFLRMHPGLFDLSVSEKKNLRVNVMMSKKIKTRTPQQCHSHHQKMVKKYGGHEGIVRTLFLQKGKALDGRNQEGDHIKDQVKVEENIVDQ